MSVYCSAESTAVLAGCESGAFDSKYLARDVKHSVHKRLPTIQSTCYFVHGGSNVVGKAVSLCCCTRRQHWQATFSVWPFKLCISRMATLPSMAQYGLCLKTMKLPCWPGKSFAISLQNTYRRSDRMQQAERALNSRNWRPNKAVAMFVDMSRIIWWNDPASNDGRKVSTLVNTGHERTVIRTSYMQILGYHSGIP